MGHRCMSKGPHMKLTVAMCPTLSTLKQLEAMPRSNSPSTLQETDIGQRPFRNTLKVVGPGGGDGGMEGHTQQAESVGKFRTLRSTQEGTALGPTGNRWPREAGGTEVRGPFCWAGGSRASQLLGHASTDRDYSGGG